ncbi:MAG: S1 RNA-binding domain-containing protein [Thermoplasmatales archaeon]|nr:S1 RNA-binding domain-containing protein [Thermoplasmatales archaeon]
MERRRKAPARRLVVPGEMLDDGGAKAGEYAYAVDGKVYSAVLGMSNPSPRDIGVIPLAGKYMPKAGDMVIGLIIDIGSSNWTVEIKAPYPVSMHVSEVPWKVEFGDTSRYLNVGDVVMLKVLAVDENKKIQVTMNDAGLRKLEGGRVIELGHSKVSRVIGRGGSMIQMLKNMTDCRVFIGENGIIWVDGDDEKMDVAVGAIELIGECSNARNLTEIVKEYIEKEIPQEGGQ